MAKTTPPAALLPIPTPQQLAWQRTETNLFVHFGVNTYTDREWGDGTEDPRIFNPTAPDFARQWAQAAKAAGIRIAILTAKHHDGFCLWPSKYTEHSVKNSPWKNGRGDVVREFVDAMREAGIKPGLYLSPWDQKEPTYGDSPRYNEHYKKQLTELLTGYGPIAEVWFDGACGEGANGKKQEYDWAGFFALVKQLQPDAVTFGDGGTDVRWVGNEEGFAGEPCWSTVQGSHWIAPGKAADGLREPRRELHHGHEGGDTWRPAETDVSIRPGWFYHAHEDTKVRSVENLLKLYFQSVGRNSLLLLNLPPTPTGLFHETDVARIAGMRRQLDRIFARDLAASKPVTASNIRGQDPAFGPSHAVDTHADSYWATDDDLRSASIEIDLQSPTHFDVILLQEPILLGQRVRAYHVDALLDNAWQRVAAGQTIGHKKLHRIEPVTATRLRVTIDDARACPTLSRIGIFDGGA